MSVPVPYRQLSVTILETIWFEYGSNTVRVQFAYGSNTVRVRFEYGSNTVRIRFRYGSSTIRVRFRYGSSTIRVRFGYGSSTIRVRFEYGSNFTCFKVCNEFEEGRIAVLGIGENPVFTHLHGIADSLNVPFISINWDSLEDENEIIALTTRMNRKEKFFKYANSRKNQTDSTDYEYSSDSMEQMKRELLSDKEPMKDTINQINIHPPAKKLMKAIIDLIDHYKWEYVTLLYHESIGLDRIEDLIRLERKVIAHDDHLVRLQVRQLSKDASDWIYLLKMIKLSGSCHIIVDIQAKFLNLFIRLVSFLSHLKV